MSQNTLRTSSTFGQVSVSAGWDYPLQEIFCNVLPLDDEDDEDDEAPMPTCLMRSSYDSVEDIVATLKADGIELPTQMVQAIQGDVETGARNVYRKFLLDGTVEQERRW